MGLQKSDMTGRLTPFFQSRLWHAILASNCLGQYIIVQVFSFLVSFIYLFIFRYVEVKDSFSRGLA